MRLGKRLLRHSWTQIVAAFLCSMYLRFVYRTSRWEKYGFDIPEAYLKNKKPFITCFWHGRLMMLPYAWPDRKDKKRPFYMLISGHPDGKLISKTVHFLGIHTIEGSSTRAGAGALKAMVRLIKEGKTVGITPDGPKGPRAKAKEGLAMASFLSKADIIPVTFSVSRKKTFSSWDQFLWAFPFSKGILIWGEPISFPLENTPKMLETICQKVENELNKIEHKADTYCKDI